MKRKLRIPRIICIGTVVMAMILTGCAKRQQQETGPEKAPGTESGKLNVVTTLFPYYDFTRQIAGDHINLTMVVPAGMDSHSFEPTPADMITIQNADVLICNGGALEHWLEQVLKAVDTSRMTIMTGMEYVDTVQEEIVEGMEEEAHGHDHGEAGHDHEEHGHDQEDEDGHWEEIEYDEHIWTSPVNAMKLVKAIEITLIAADPENKDSFETNAANYLEKLEELDQEFRDVVAGAKRTMIIVGDKFPYRYLADEYGLRYRAAFSGCSTDTEPSAKTIAYLMDKMRTEEIPVIYYPELTSHRVSEIISEETGAEPLLLHSCHNVTRSAFDGGVTYLELMEQNVTNLKKGLE